ncbi:hypothetical protein [Streptomyces sp. NPDC002845]
MIDGKMNQLLKELQQDEISAVAYASQVASLAQDREKVTNQEGPKPVTVWTGTGEGYAEWWERSRSPAFQNRKDPPAVFPGRLVVQAGPHVT